MKRLATPYAMTAVTAVAAMTVAMAMKSTFARIVDSIQVPMESESFSATSRGIRIANADIHRAPFKKEQESARDIFFSPMLMRKFMFGAKARLIRANRA
ncbi:hypothetical protein [Paraburkholderia ferrariae]|uniref:hypothetical protein n=1 Tax=Paraburkholderia ferrariae TaxID=386056 RepID=UPI0012EB163C|nr:hypothetical protein [Paraburkholderia ferrariae]